MFAFYTTNCPKCMLLEKLLKDSGKEYDTIDLKRDGKALEELTAKGFSSAPLLRLPDGRILPFKEAVAFLKEAR